MSATTAVTEAEASELVDAEPGPEGTEGAEKPTEQAPAEHAAETPAERIARLEQEGDIAADYLEGLLDIADLDGDIDMDVEGDRAAVSIVGGKLSHLVGSGGEVLDALQELTRLAVLRETGERSRLMLDHDGQRAAAPRALTRVGTQAARKVAETGQPGNLSASPP